MKKYTIWNALNESAENEFSKSKVMDYTPDRKLDKTFFEMRNEVKDIAGELQNEYGQRKHFAIIASACYEWLLAFFAITASNNIAVLLDKRLPEKQLLELIEESDSEIIVYDESTSTAIEEIKNKTGNRYKFISLCKNSQNIPVISDFKKGNNRSFTEPEENSLAAIFTTSATTGKMKLVMLSHKNIISAILSAIKADDRFGISDTYLLSLPLTHAFGMVTMVCGFCCGMSLAICHDPIKMLDDCKTYKATFLMTVPMVFEFCMMKMEALVSKGMSMKDAKKTLFGESAKFISCGGSALDSEVALKYCDYGFMVRVGYGLTELSSIVSADLNCPEHPGSVGKALDILEAKTVDGELLLKGDSVMMGYYKNEEETKNSMQDGWFHTGFNTFLR